MRIKSGRFFKHGKKIFFEGDGISFEEGSILRHGNIQEIFNKGFTFHSDGGYLTVYYPFEIIEKIY